MPVESLAAIVIPLLVLAVLWTVVRHWILPFVLGFALAVALGPAARPMVAGAWSAVAGIGDAVFGTRRDEPYDGGWERRRGGEPE